MWHQWLGVHRSQVDLSQSSRNRNRSVDSSATSHWNEYGNTGNESSLHLSGHPTSLSPDTKYPGVEIRRRPSPPSSTICCCRPRTDHQGPYLWSFERSYWPSGCSDTRRGSSRSWACPAAYKRLRLVFPPGAQTPCGLYTQAASRAHFFGHSRNSQLTSQSATRLTRSRNQKQWRSQEQLNSGRCTRSRSLSRPSKPTYNKC